MDISTFKKPFILMGMGHFHKLLCEEMLFLLHRVKNDGLRYEVIIFYGAV
jgi:hypothetical protein